MPPKNLVRGVRSSSRKTVDESKSGLLQSGDIESLHVLVRRFEEELLELKQKNMDRNNSSSIDAAARRVRMIALLEEFSALADQEPSLNQEFREAAQGLKLTLANSFEVELSPSDHPVPDTAPELWKDRSDRKETSGEFIERVYSFCLDRIALRDLRRLDFKLYHDFSVRKPGGNILPSGRKLLTVKELNDMALQQRGFSANNPDAEARESLRLLRVHQSRSRKPRGRSLG
jgi:hypothetical protein